jgi:uncharacterized glyoxalase superfamily protein PhnB
MRLLLVLLVLTANASGQTYRIDSIKSILPLQSGQNEVNSLNQLSKEYAFYWVHSDSSLKYAEIAFQKASAINYDHGKAEALCMQANTQGRLLGQPRKMETLSKQALEILKNGKDLTGLSLAHYLTGVAMTIMGRYHESEEPFKKAKQLALESGDRGLIGWAEQGIGFMNFKGGSYWRSFPHLIEAQQAGKHVNDSVLTTLSLVLIARSFNMAGDPQTALNYYHQAFQYSMPFIRLWSHHEDMAFSHLQLKNYDSALYYQQLNVTDLATQTTDEKVRGKFSNYMMGYSIEIQLGKKQYDTIFNQVLPALHKLRMSNDVTPYFQSLLALGKAFEATGNYKSSLQFTRELYQATRGVRNRGYRRDANQLLASIFEKLHQPDSAYFYFKQFTAMKDSMETMQYKGRTALYLAASEAENKIRLLKKDKELSEKQLALNKKEIQKQAQLKNLLIAVSVALILISLLVVRNIILRRKNEQLRNQHEQTSLKRKAMDLEMQALRAQMNPHFIFNCLSAIDNLIQTSQADKATSYLSKFAKLIRAVLDSSKNNLVPFQKDLETMQLYLEMEKFRCNNKFVYHLYVQPALLHGDYKVPPLIVQPFIENAIHHGLLNKKGTDRNLDISIKLEKEHIIYSIIDNGIGRQKAAGIKERNKPEHQSYGIAITRERIHLHNQNGIDDDLVITDLREEGIAAGTKAVIRINCSKS